MPVSSFLRSIICLCLAAGAILSPSIGWAQQEAVPQTPRFIFGPRVEIGYALDAGAAIGGVGAFVEAQIGTLREGSVSVTASATQLVVFDHTEASPSLLDGGVLWAAPDRRLILEAGLGSIRRDGDRSDLAVRLAAGREYMIDTGRSLRIHLALRLLGEGETSLGVAGSYPFKIF